jgi:chromosome segregation ATPase
MNEELLQLQNTKLRDENDDIKKTNQNMKLHVDELTYEISTLKTSIEWLKRSQRSSSDSTHDLEKEKQTMQRKIDECRKEISKLSSSLSTATDKREELERQLYEEQRKSRESISDLELQVKLLQDQLGREKEKVAKKKKQNVELQKQRDELIQSSASDSRLQFWKKMIDD